MDELQLPWSPPTRQQDGAKTEKRLLKQEGARVHPRSGAGRIKEDGSKGQGNFDPEDVLYEVKDCRKSYTLKATDLRQSFVRAVQQGRTSVWLVYFDDCNFTAKIELVPGGQEAITE